MPGTRSVSIPIALASMLALVIAAMAYAPSAALAHTASAQVTAQTCSQALLPLPDPNCTPGVTNPDVTQSTIDTTICVSGWTATVRPSTSYTTPLKIQQIAEYGYSDTSTSSYEEDHLIPLELGGSPRDPKNLWPEPYAGATGETAYSKDSVENKLKAMVCAGTADLVPAQEALLNDWRTAVAELGG